MVCFASSCCLNHFFLTRAKEPKVEPSGIIQTQNTFFFPVFLLFVLVMRCDWRLSSSTIFAGLFWCRICCLARSVFMPFSRLVGLKCVWLWKGIWILCVCVQLFVFCLFFGSHATSTFFPLHWNFNYSQLSGFTIVLLQKDAACCISVRPCKCMCMRMCIYVCVYVYVKFVVVNVKFK